MTALEHLVLFGFERVTEWVMKGDKIGPASFGWPDHGGWLYAFIVRNEVKYIGMTDRVLRSRLGDYSHASSSQPMPSQTLRLQALIRNEIASGNTVMIYGWKHPDKDTPLTNETLLISKHRPAWNIR